MTDHFDGWPADDAGWPADGGPDGDDRDPAGWGVVGDPAGPDDDWTRPDDDWTRPDPDWDPDGRYGDPGPGHGEDPARPGGEAEPIGYGDDTAADPADPTGAGDPGGDPPGGTPPPDGFPTSDTHAGGDTPFGADPDLPRHGDDWPTGEPEPAEWSGSPPEPVDGLPWTDPTNLGTGADAAGGWTGPTGAPDPAGLAEYAGEPLPPGTDPWRALADSADPATGALARFWAPGSTPPPP